MKNYKNTESDNEWYILYCLIDDSCKYDILSKIQLKHFSSIVTKEIYAFCSELIQKDIKIDITLLISKFSQYEIIIKQYFTPVNTKNYSLYIDELLNNYANNSIKNFGIKISKNDIGTKEIYSEIQNLIDDISDKQNDNICLIKDIIDEYFDNLLSEEETLTGIPFYIKDIDNIIDGLKSGDYIIIAGRPSMGKTSLATHIVMENVLNGVSTVFFSMEMSRNQILSKILASKLEIELWKIKKKRLNEVEKEKLINIKEALKSSPLIIDENSLLTIEDINAKVQKAKIQFPDLGLIVIDYLGLMDGKGGNRNEIVSNVSKGLKSIAKQYKVPVIALSQLSRLCELRENKRPVLSDLRDSGSLEQDADIVMFVYRDHYYNYNPQHESICEIIIGKFRDGQTGKTIVNYDLKTQTWKSILKNSRLWEYAKKFYFETKE